MGAPRFLTRRRTLAHQLWVLLLVVGAVGGVFLFRTGNSAATFSMSVTSVSPSSYRTICPDANPRVDFAFAITGVTPHANGHVDYTVNLKWKRCSSAASRAYAIYGSAVWCPLSGYYGEGGQTHDCVKYIGSPRFSGAGNSLTCPRGTNSDCVTDAFGAVHVNEDQPSGTETRVIHPAGFDIPNWNTRKQSSGHYDIGANMCEYFKTPNYGPNDSVTQKRCIAANIRVSWVSVNSAPTGNLSIRCINAITGAQQLTYNFNDPDDAGASHGSIGTGASQTNIMGLTTASPGTRNVTDKNGGTTYKLYVRDTSQFGANLGMKLVKSVSSSPCKISTSTACSTRLNPANPVEVGSSGYSATVGISSYGLPAAVTSGGNTYSYSVTNQHLVIKSDAPPRSTTVNGVNSATVAFGAQTVPMAYGVNGTMSYTINALKNGTVTNSINGSTTCPTALKTYVVKPYLQVTGGDVISGVYPAANQTACATAAGGGAGTITTWNSGSPGYNGGAVQYAAMANGLINWFASAKDSASTVPKGLSFANTSGIYGGNFNGVASNCNFTAEINSLPASHKLGTTSWNSLPAGGGTYYIDGDLTLTGDVTYGWTGRTNNPQFKVIVNGNINIRPGVSELDGAYISLGGTINTCAGVAANSRAADCSTPLTVYGALMGKVIGFYRTAGTLNGTTPGVAEHIIYTPEVWLPTDSGELSNQYNSITSLPPIL